jgi:hypothetical protein
MEIMQKIGQKGVIRTLNINLKFSYFRFLDIAFSKRRREKIQEKIIENYNKNNLNFENKRKNRRYREIIIFDQQAYTFEVRKPKENRIDYRILYIEDENKYEERKERIIFYYGLKMKLKKEMKMFESKNVEMLLKHNLKKNPYSFSVVNMMFVHSIKYQDYYYISLIWRDYQNNTIAKFVDMIDSFKYEDNRGIEMIKE